MENHYGIFLVNPPEIMIIRGILYSQKIPSEEIVDIYLVSTEPRNYSWVICENYKSAEKVRDILMKSYTTPERLAFFKASKIVTAEEVFNNQKLQSDLIQELQGSYPVSGGTKALEDRKIFAQALRVILNRKFRDRFTLSEVSSPVQAAVGIYPTSRIRVADFLGEVKTFLEEEKIISREGGSRGVLWVDFVFK